MRSDQTVYDAWIVGVHELPDDVPWWFAPEPGMVILHTRRLNGRWFSMDTADFVAEFEWISEAELEATV